MADTSGRWLILTTRTGQEKEDPTKEDLSHAIEELGQLDSKSPVEEDTIWLHCGTQAGPIYVLSVNRDGTTSLSVFVNQDADDPIEELTKKITLEMALALWKLLADDKPDQVRDGSPTTSRWLPIRRR